MASFTGLGFLKSPSVSLDTGSSTIIVTGSVDCSFVSSGTAIFLDGGQILLEGLKGTSYDPVSGESQITIRDSWQGSPLVGVDMKAFNTIEGLRDAIIRARDIISNVDEADATIQDQLTQIQNMLDLIGDAPTYAAQAEAARDAAILAQTASETARDGAQTAETGSIQARDAAVAAQGLAEAARDAAQLAEAAAQAAQLAAENAQAASESARDTTQGYLTAAEAARDAAIVAKDAALAAQLASEAARDAAVIAKDLAEAANVSAQEAKDLAEAAKNISLANANLKGYWDNQTGAAAVPYAVIWSSQVWMLTVDIPDVTLSEPSVGNTDWITIASIGGSAADSDALGGETAQQWQDKIDNLQSQIGTINGTISTIQTNITTIQQELSKVRVLALAGL